MNKTPAGKRTFAVGKVLRKYRKTAEPIDVYQIKAFTKEEALSIYESANRVSNLWMLKVIEDD